MSVLSQRFIDRHRAPRVQIQYTTVIEGSDKVLQLPFVTGVLADLSGSVPAIEKPDMTDRYFMDFDIDNFDSRMAAIQPAVSMKVANKLVGKEDGDELSVHLVFTKIDDFLPKSVVRQVPSLRVLFERWELFSNLQTYMDGKEGARTLVEKILDDAELLNAIALLGERVGDDDDTPNFDRPFRNAGVERTDLAALVEGQFRPRTERAKDQINRALAALAQMLQEMPHPTGVEPHSLISKIVAELDDSIGAQLNEILHHSDFQEMESTWRGLHYFVSRTETDEMLKIRVMNVSKNELYRHLRLYPNAVWDQSGLFKKIHSSEFDQLGGQPYGCLIGDYYFSHLPTDVQLMRDLSKIAVAARAPFIAAAHPNLLGMDSWQELPLPRNLMKLFDTPEYAAWHSLRNSDEARYLALALPRVLARLPYGHNAPSVEEMHFVEDVPSDVKPVDSAKFVWLNSAYVMAVNINRAFKRYGWCARIYGFDAGTAEQLLIYRGAADSGVGALGPTEIAIDDRREAELANSGLLPLLQRKNSDIATFMSAPSLHNPTKGRTDPNVTATDQISSKLPFALASGRFVHYLKCICRDLPTSLHPDEAARFLNEWIKNYVDENPETSSEAVKAQRPLATAEIVLLENLNSGTYSCRFFIRPHYQFEALPESIRMEVQLSTPAG
jgi:type VI secretion system protein ImpC